MAKIKKKGMLVQCDALWTFLTSIAGTSGQAKNYITRTQAVRKLQISLPDFRRLCIFKGKTCMYTVPVLCDTDQACD